MIVKNQNKLKNIKQIDDIDRKILNLLTNNSREKLLLISREIGLSIPSVKARIDNLVDKKIITRFTIQTDLEKIGMPVGVHARIKLKNINEETHKNFINLLQKNKNIINLFSTLGEFDLIAVVLARDSSNMNVILSKIRHEFADIIADWETSYIMEIYKLEEYSY